MGQITIEGRKVTVSDDFFQLSPEQQDATVDEIAQSLGLTGGNQSLPMAEAGTPVGVQTRPGQGVGPEGMQANLAELSQATLGAAPQQNANPERTDDYIRAKMEATKMIGPRGQDGGMGQGVGDFIDSAIMSTPFIDEAYSATIGNVGRMMRDGVGPVDAYKREKMLQDELSSRRWERSPVASMGGAVANAIGTGTGMAKAGLAFTPRLVSGAPLMAKLGAGAFDAGISGVMYGAGQGNGLDERVSNAIGGGGVGFVAGGAAPVIGAGLRKIGGKVASGVRSVFKPDVEAASVVRSAMGRDAGREALRSGDDAIAARNGQTIINADRGGETVRALARASSNSSPEARDIMHRVTNDRFSGQSTRAAGLLKRIVGADIDDLAFQEKLKATAKLVNGPAYKKAYSHPNAQGMWNTSLQQLMQSPAMQSAAKTTVGKSANVSAVRGGNAVKNPFIFAEDGSVQLVKGTRPSLEFWDKVKQVIDDDIEIAKRAGAKSHAADLMAIKNKLVETLDNAVPEYKQARVGAWEIFEAEDALEAGKMFGRTTRNTPEMAAALKNATTPERQAFQSGYASELVDKINASNDKVNVIRNIFGSNEARSKMELAFGAAKAAEIEDFVRIETATDMLRNAFGNSTTTQQLQELGLISGIGATGAASWLYSGDFGTGAAVAASLAGAKYAKGKVDNNVLQQIAKLLASGDKAALAKVAGNAKLSGPYRQALRQVTDKILANKNAVMGMGAAQLRSKQ